jgi:hypothetical protein
MQSIPYAPGVRQSFHGHIHRIWRYLLEEVVSSHSKNEPPMTGTYSGNRNVEESVIANFGGPGPNHSGKRCTAR